MSEEFLGLLDDMDSQSSTGNPGSTDHPADPAEVVRLQCAMWAETASSLRRGAPWPGLNATPSDVLSALVEARSRLDRLEVVLGNAMSLRTATASQARAMEEAADDAWDDQANNGRRGLRREYEGPRERYAYWEVAIRPLRLQAREARARADLAKDVYDRVKLAYDGLNELRRDLLGRLTHLRWESHMEQ